MNLRAAGMRERKQLEASHSLETGIRRFSGAYACRVWDAPRTNVREHAHDWPVLSIYVSGGVENATEHGKCVIDSPWVVFYGAGAPHANRIGATGFEQVQIELDPDWLNIPALRNLRGPLHWFGGAVSARGRDLGRLWCSRNVPEARLVEATSDFLEAAAQHDQNHAHPTWVGEVRNRLREHPGVSAAAIAADLNLNPHWLAQAYRRAMGEGLRETSRRLRVEAAASMLRTTDLGAADVAAAAGFCDQSHMIRSFLAVLGRSPGAVRGEWKPSGGD